MSLNLQYLNVTGIEYETLNTTLNLHTYFEIPELLFVKNAVKHFFHMGYGTAISDKIDKKFTPPPRPPPPPPLLPNSRMGKWRVLAQFRAASSLIWGRGAGMVVCWAFYFVQGSSSRTHIQPRPLGCKGCCLNF